MSKEVATLDLNDFCVPQDGLETFLEIAGRNVLEDAFHEDNDTLVAAGLYLSAFENESNTEGPDNIGATVHAIDTSLIDFNRDSQDENRPHAEIEVEMDGADIAVSGIEHAALVMNAPMDVDSMDGQSLSSVA